MSFLLRCTSFPLRLRRISTNHNHRLFHTSSTKIFKRSFTDSVDANTLQEHVPPPHCGMELLVLGTASAKPHADSSLSSCLLRLSSKAILFDCGDGVQSLLLKNRIRHTTIKQIFITHLHGDHIFGLPALVTLLSLTSLPTPFPRVEIYGPPGLRKFLRTVLSISRTQYEPGSFLVHELSLQNPSDEAPAEGEKNFIYNNELKGWKIYESDTETVYAAPIRHTIFCLGYVVEEKPRAPGMNVEKLVEAGFPPGPLYRGIKSGEVKSLVLKNGTEVPASDFLHPQVRGRKLVYLGDTNDASQIQHLASDCDLLVHEATLESKNEQLAFERGHSTAAMAAKFATKINAHHLCLTHFGHALIDPEQYVLVKQEAAAHFANPIYAAEPSMVVHITTSKDVHISRNKQRD